MVWAQSCGKTNLYPNLLTACEGFIPTHAGRTHSPRLPVRALVGLIPTHARNTCCPDSSPSPTRAHPRPRGENTYVVTPWCYAEGSSPLTQGKPQVTVEGTVEEGLIPAHAGKTLHNPAHRSASTAHPRSRGENIYSVIAAVADWGSSPLTRGKQSIASQRRRTPRLIPAHAGKTCSQRCGCGRRRAHPRSRGENRAGCACVEGAAHPRSRGETR